MSKLKSLVLGAVLLTGCATTKHPIVRFRNGSVVYLENLDVHEGVETAVYRLTQEQGEKRLVEMACSYDKEDAWIFIDRQEPLWVDVGDATVTEKLIMPDGTIKMGSYSVAGNREAIWKFLKKGDKATHYHYHPDFLFWEGGSLSEASSQIYTQSLAANLPSTSDYLAHYCLKKELSKKGIILNPSRVAGPVFTISYDIDKKYDEKDIGDKTNQILQDTIYNIYADDYEKRLNDYINGMRKLGIDLKIIKYHVNKKRFNKNLQ